MTGSAIAVLAIAWGVLMSPFSMARVDKNTRLKARLKKPDITDLVFVGYNNWSYVMRNNGSYFYDSPDADGNGNNAGGEFPRGSGITIVFAAGVYIATIKNGNKVVSETEFATEFQPGRIVTSGVPFDQLEADDPAAQANQVYLIDRSLSGDDYSNWPSDAPVGPFGEPGLIADAQTWAVYNDLDISLSQEGPSVSPDPGLGMQVVIESFAFNAGPLSDVVYLKFTISNMSDANYANSYLGLWMDPDVDNASNDIVGVDTARGLGFCYNADASDNAFATGFDFFQGPVVNTADVSATLAAKNAGNTTVLVYNSSLKRYEPTALPAGQIWLGATSFNTYANGTDPADNIERYNLLAGLFADGNPKFGTGVADYYAFRGDPVTQQGNPNVASTADAADQRMLHGVGPFTIPAGSSQEIWAGVVGAAGTDRLNAVANMRNTDDLAQQTFEAGLIAPAPPDVPKISVSSLDGAVVVTWQNNAEFSEDIAGGILGINTANGYTANYVANDFQGYRVWKSRTGLPGSFTMLAEYDKNDGITSIVNQTINTAANLEIEEIRLGDDTGLQYSFTDHDVVNGQPYYYSVTAYDAQPYIAGPGSFTTGETKYVITTRAIGVRLTDYLDANTHLYLDSLNADTSTVSNGGPMMGDTLFLEGDTLIIDRVEGANFIWDYNTLAAAFRAEGKNTPASIAIGNDVSFLLEFTFSDGHHESTIFRMDVTDIRSFSGSIPTPSGLPISLETSPTANVVLVIPMAPLIGQNFEASVSDVTHTGPSDGAIEVEIVDPTKVRSVTYTLSHFAVPTDCTGAPLRGSAFLAASGIAYRVLAGSTILTIDSRVDDPRTYYDVNTNNVYDAGVDVPLDDSKFAFAQAIVGNEATEQPIVVDGMKITVFGPSNDVKFFQVIATGGGTLAAPDMGAFAFNASGFPTIDGGEPGSAYAALGAGALNDRPNVPNLLTTVAAASAANGGKWGIHTGEVGGGFSFDFFKTRTFRNDNFSRFIPYDFEMRFTAAGGMGHFAFTTGAQAPVPFEIWNIGINTPTDPSDDYRMYPRVLDDVTALPFDDTYDLGGFDHTISGGDNDPYLDWVYFMNPANRSPGQAGYNASVAANGGALQTPNGEVMARTVLVNFNGGSVSDASFPANVNQQRPANGTIFRIVSTKPNTVNDQFSFTGTARQTTASKSAMKAALKNAKVVPNPYYGRSEYQASLFDKRIKFINLPGTCTIRVFTVSGDLVATIAHNATSNNDRTNTNPLSATATGAPAETSVETWDLRNPGGKFVASGMYIAVIDAPGIGKKTLKFAVIQEEIKINGPDVR